MKKGTSRKNRFLLIFNGLLAPAQAGRLGNLARMDSRNPVLYMEHSQGRIKLLGTMVFPKNKYMVRCVGLEDIYMGWERGALCENGLFYDSAE